MPTPSLLIVPARFKSGKLYSQLPTSGAGDFTVTRATIATRVNASGLIESVASGIPRLDYFASGGTVGCPALLVEPAATNGILNSTDTRTSWVLGANLTSGAIDVIGVSGNNLTVAVSGSLGSDFSVLRRTGNNVALANGSTYTISFLMKQTATHTVGGYYAVITGAGSGDLAAGFNVSGSFSSGSFFTSNSTINRIRRVERFGTDVYRCSETFTMSASGTLTQLGFGPVSSVTSASSPAVGAGIGFAAPQIELGSVPTSFIPTTTAAVTRNADVVSVSGAVSGSIGQLSGTIYAEVDLRNSILGTLLVIDDGDTSDFISIARLANLAIRVQIRNGPMVTITTIITSSAVALGVHKIALAYTNGDYALYIDGVSAGTSTNSTNYPATSLTQCVLSNTNYGFLNDRILAAALYTTRLSNAELAALTSP